MKSTNQFIDDDTYKQILSQVYLGDGWKQDTAPSGKHHLSIQKKQVFPDRVQAVKVIARVSLKADHILKVVLNVENRLKISDHTKEAKFVEKTAADNFTDVFYTCLGAPSRLVSARDFVVARRWDSISDCCALIGAQPPSPPKGYIVALKSVVRDDCPPTSGNVRGEFVMQAIMIHELEDGTSEIRVLNQVELNGWIPSAVQGYFQTSVPCQMPDLLERGVEYERSIGHITD